MNKKGNVAIKDRNIKKTVTLFKYLGEKIKTNTDTTYKISVIDSEQCWSGTPKKIMESMTFYVSQVLYVVQENGTDILVSEYGEK